jgi:hypothetical protein
MTAAPVAANAGAALFLGTKNTANLRTTLSGNVATSSFRIVNSNPKGTALTLSVRPGNPPLKVTSTAKVLKLNADRLDNRSANQLLRVAHAEVPNAPEVNGDILTTSVKAPRAGLLVIQGGLEVDGIVGNGSTFYCSLALDSSWVQGSERAVSSQLGGPSAIFGSCESSVTVPVDAGTRTVALRVVGLDTANLYLGNASLSALYVPFDGDGKVP